MGAVNGKKTPEAKKKPKLQQLAETKPVVETKPMTETKPVAETKPEVEKKLEAETKPVVETKPEVEAIRGDFLPHEVVCHILSLAVESSTGRVLELATVSKTWKSLIFSGKTSNMWKQIFLHSPMGQEITTTPRVKNWYSYYKAKHLAVIDFKKDFQSFRKVNPIENCGLSFPRLGEHGTINEQELGIEWELKCPMLWENLKDALISRGPLSVRPNELLCTVCNHQVQWVYTKSELRAAVEEGHCVIYDVGGDNPEYHRKKGKVRMPSEKEEKKIRKEDKAINQRSKQRVQDRGHWQLT